MESSNVDTLPNNIHERQHKFGRILVEINRRITFDENYKITLEFLFDSLQTIIPYDRIGVALIENGQICSKWMKSNLHSASLGVGYCSPLEGSSLKQILDTGCPRIINNLLEYGQRKPESESTQLALKDGIRSSLTCPLYAKSEPVGIVFFSSGFADTYNSEHVETYLEIAVELSAILNQDQLRNQAEATDVNRQNTRMLLHDLKSPLSVIQGFLQLAQEEVWYGTLDEDAKTIFSTLNRNAAHMQHLLKKLILKSVFWISIAFQAMQAMHAMR